jgi:hypothetical protein
MPFKNYEDQLAHSKLRYQKDKQYHREKAARWVRQNKKRKCWLDQRATSKRRGVDFRLTFEEYCEFWGEDFEKKGRKPNDLCMGRYEDDGAYEVGNIYKCTNAENKQGPKPKPDPGLHPDIPF